MKYILTFLLKYLITFILTAVLLISSLLAVAMIPRTYIQKNMLESAEYLTEKNEHFFFILKDVQGSRIDQYADSILLCMAWYLDSEHSVTSITWDRYYWNRTSKEPTVNQSFYQAVTDAPLPNEQYLRYWHGSMIFVKLLHLILNIRQIYALHGIILAALILSLMYLLAKYGYRKESIILGISMITVSVWFVPRCLEYTWMFLLSGVVSLIAVYKAVHGRYKHFDILFLVTGMVAAFIDFFTTETLTLLIPLLLLLRIREKTGLSDNNWRIVLNSGSVWGIGYILTWSLKWILSSFVLQENVWKYVKDNVELHLSPGIRMSLPELQIQGILRNVFTLFPAGYGVIGGVFLMIMILVLFVIPVYRNQLTIKKIIPWNWIKIYLFLGLIPYIRYILIAHHSWHHYFFMHRAQAATIVALGFILLDTIESNHNWRNLYRKAVPEDA